MTTKISAIIAQYITTETRLIIPEVGTLIRRKENGEIVFMEMLKKTDGILVGLVVNSLDVSPSKANEIVNGYIATIKQQLVTSKKFIINGVGILLVRPNGGVDFSFNPFAQSLPEPERRVDILEEDKPLAPIKPSAPAQPVQPVQPTLSSTEVRTAPQHTTTPQPRIPSPQPKKVIYATEEDEPTERKSRIQPHHTRKRVDGITIIALIALLLAFLSLIWGLIPSNDRVEVEVNMEPTQEVVVLD